MAHKLAETLCTYKVVRCKKCNEVGITTAKKTYKCLSCGRSTSVVKKPTGLAMTHFGVGVIFHTECGRQAREVMIKARQQLGTPEEAEFVEFRPKNREEDGKEL